MLGGPLIEEPAARRARSPPAAADPRCLRRGTPPGACACACRRDRRSPPRRPVRAAPSPASASAVPGRPCWRRTVPSRDSAIRAASLVTFTMRPRRSASNGTASLNQGDGRARVDGEHAAEPLHVEVHQRPDAAQLRRVVHEHVQPAKRAGRADQPRPHGGVRDVAGHRPPRVTPSPASESATSCSGRGCRAPTTRSIATPGEHPGDHFSEAPARARHDCHTIRRLMVIAASPHSSVELQVHLKSSGYFWDTGGMDDVLTIGEVATRSGIASSALRFYEERGLIQSVRNRSGHRRYPRGVLRRVAFIVFAQRIGLSLEEVAKELAKLPHQSRARARRLGEALGRMDGADSRPHRGARAAPGRPHRVHRLRLPVARSVSAGQPGRSGSAPWSRAPLLDGRPWFSVIVTAALAVFIGAAADVALTVSRRIGHFCRRAVLPAPPLLSCRTCSTSPRPMP